MAIRMEPQIEPRMTFWMGPEVVPGKIPRIESEKVLWLFVSVRPEQGVRAKDKGAGGTGNGH